ncbi:MAG: potassium channel family protein [Planctomycetota bacterium]
MAVLYPRAVTGPITALTYRVYHHISQRVLGPKSKLLLFSGPVLIVTQATVWATLLLLGVSLIVWPQLAVGIVSPNASATETNFVTAVYYAGFSITTLGVGDLVPKTAFARLVTITAAAIGFSFFTLVLAYIISVYSALGRRNQFASEIDYRTGRTGDTLAYLRLYLASNDPALLNQDLCDLASKLADLLESHHFYPALHYFRFSEPRYAMSRMLRFCLETASLLRALGEVQPDQSAVNSEAVQRLWHASLQLLEDAKEHFVICRVSRDDVDLTLATRFLDQVRSMVSDQSMVDDDKFASAYSSSCHKWSNDLASLEQCTMTSNHCYHESA